MGRAYQVDIGGFGGGAWTGVGHVAGGDEGRVKPAKRLQFGGSDRNVMLGRSVQIVQRCGRGSGALGDCDGAQLGKSPDRLGIEGLASDKKDPLCGPVLRYDQVSDFQVFHWDAAVRG